MKNGFLTILNGLPMASLILLYMYKEEMTVYLFLAWFLICVVNALFLHKISHFLGMNFFLCMTSAFGIYVNTQFYYSFVYLDNSAKLLVWDEITFALIYLACLTVLGIVLRISIRYMTKKKRSLKAKRYRIVKLGRGAIEELVLDHFIKNQEEYTGTKPDNTLFDYSFDWENKSFIYAVKEEKNSGESFMDLSKLHGVIPETTDSVFKKGIYKDYYEKELANPEEKF